MDKFNVKTIDKKIIEVEGKLVKKPVPPKTPAWFKAWSQTFEKKIDEKFEKIDERLDKVDQRLDKIDQRFDNLIKINHLKE